VAYCKALLQHFVWRGSVKPLETSGYLVSGPIIETRTSRMRNG